MIRRFFIAVFVLVAAAGAGFAWWAQRPLADIASPVNVEIPAGAHLREISQRLAASTGMAPWPFMALAKLTGNATRLRTGAYVIAPGTTPLDLLGKLVRGETVMASLTIVEGWTFAQMRAAIQASADLSHDAQGLSEAALMDRIGAPGVAPEGRFFPDTYRFAKGASDLTLYRQAYETMRKVLDAAWAARATDLPLASPEEALILASIVEKETGSPADRRKISAVFNNRLRRGMLLQTDPTVIYGMGTRFDGNLRKRDLLEDTPYNTYTRAGLPPTPIAMPGKAAIEAAVRPEPVSALYFVARGDGSSEFSDTLDAHNRAVNKYQR